jgi:queuine tRNA-ribosyltransferase
MVFDIVCKDKKTNARIGVLKTKSGLVETPFFMPVSTKAVAKFLTQEQLKDLGAVATISNGFILSLRPGVEVIKKFGGIRKFMNTSLINFTDSGGFQMYSPSIYVKSDEKGVMFRNPISGEKIFMTPEENMKIQLNIFSDVAMCLDRMPLYEDSKEEIKKSVDLTSMWAKRCKQIHDKMQSKVSDSERQLLFGITQGGIHKDLREYSAKELVKLDFDGYSIGGFGMGETFQEEMRIVKQQKKIIPENKPVYLMGIGSPLEILEAISYGVDIFDSRLPTQNARRGSLFSSKGNLKILNKKYELDKAPIDSNCDCVVCKSYSRAYVRFLLKQEESVGKELASYHNLYYLMKLIDRAKEAIRKGKFKEFKDKICIAYS